MEKRCLVCYTDFMRIIHTADWHLGNQMHDINRTEEARNFLKWLKAQIEEKSAEALIVSGDIFDTVNPSNEARKLYYTFLASLADTCCRNVVITGGNHDSAMMLDAAKELLEVMNIRVIGSVNNLLPEDMVIELASGGAVAGGGALCLAVPFVREVELRNLVEVGDGASDVADKDLYSRAYGKLYEEVFAAAEKVRAGREIPVMATGHLYAAKLEGRLEGARADQKSDDGVKVLDTVGTLGNVPASVFPDQLDYVALGHIHYSTMVAKNPKIRYSGSPFVMGFDEALLPHYVLCVDLEYGKSAVVEKLEVPQTYIYRRLSGTLDEIKNQLKEYITLKSEKNVFLEICYKREAGTNAQEFLEDDVKLLPENIKVVSWKLMEQEMLFSSGFFEDFSSEEIKNLDDEQVFRQLILSKIGLDPESSEAKAVLEKFLPLFISESNS